MQEVFFRTFADELSKIAADMACDTPGKKKRSKGRGKGLAVGKGKGPLGIPKKANAIKEKIEAARRDPSTKANPKDTGPKGSGTKDPRFKAMKFRKSAAELLDIIKEAMRRNMVTSKMKPRKVIDPNKPPAPVRVKGEARQFFADISKRGQ